jgi:hypothetical protein
MTQQRPVVMRTQQGWGYIALGVVAPLAGGRCIFRRSLSGWPFQQLSESFHLGRSPSFWESCCS